MQLLLYFETSAGTFYIGESADGRFHPIYNHESLGSYSKIWQATEDLSLGVTYTPHQTTGEPIDTSELGIPDTPGDWDRVSR